MGKNLMGFLARSTPNRDSARLILVLGLQESQYQSLTLEGRALSLELFLYMNFEIVHEACWPTSSRHVRLSAACLVKATGDNNLKDESTSMSISQSKL